jgi:hypothetical protein
MNFSESFNPGNSFSSGEDSGQDEAEEQDYAEDDTSEFQDDYQEATDDIPLAPNEQIGANACYEETNFEKGPIWILVDMTPEEAEQSIDILHLFSESGEFDVERPVSEYTDTSTDSVNILFDEVPMNLTYTLEIMPSAGEPYTVFSNVTYGDIRIEKQLDS